MNEANSRIVAQLLKKDIVYYFLQVRDYGYIMGDVYWDSIYTLEYWKYLNSLPVEPNEAMFIRNGCYILILAMCAGALDDGDHYVRKNLNEIHKAVQASHVDHADSSRLRDIVLDALNQVRLGNEMEQDLYEDTRWVHRTFIVPIVGAIQSDVDF